MTPDEYTRLQDGRSPREDDGCPNCPGHTG